MPELGEYGYLAKYGVSLRRVLTVEDAGEFMRWLGEKRDLLGFDTETAGLRPGFDRIRLAQFGDMKTGWVIPFERWGGVVEEALHKYTGDLVLHNSKFDSRMYCAADKKFTWPWHRSHDTMTMAHLVNPLRPKGLKPLSAMLVDPQAVAAQKTLDVAMHDNKWTWGTVPLDYPAYWIYAAMDPVLTCHNADILLPEVRAKYAYPYDLEMGTTRVIAKMEAKGALVDIPYTEEMFGKMMTWCHDAYLWLNSEFGIPLSDKGTVTVTQLQRFFAENGIDVPTKYTKGGQLSLDKEVLQGTDHIVAETILKIRKAEKNVGPYFKNFIELADSDGRVHPNIWTMGTRTARMSITDPALQTLPRKDPTVRTAFIPSPGNALLTCDYDQVEARLMAHFSQSPGLRDAFQADKDFFLGIASEIFDEDITYKKDPRRDLTKGVTYGKIYGAGEETMARTAKVTEAQMHLVNTEFDRKFPEVGMFMKAVVQKGRERRHSEGSGYVMTPTGRRLMCDPGQEYALVNYLIQSHAAEILKRKIIELDTVIPDYMILPVHDELVFDVPKEDVLDVQRTVEEIMSDTTNYFVPITASSDVMYDNWGSKYRST